MKEIKGITMVSLVVTIVVLLILSTIAIKIGIDFSQNHQDTKAKSELQIVQHAVLEQYYKYTVTNNESDLKGKKLQRTEVEQSIINMNITLQDTQGYYELNPKQIQEIGINSAKDTYIVNYKTGEVMNITKQKTSDGKVLYVSGE